MSAAAQHPADLAGEVMTMDEARRARLGAFADTREIDWPEAPGIATRGERERGWIGPYLAGTYLLVADAGRNLADDWDTCRAWYHDKTDAQCVAMRDYYLAHRDLFAAQAWREAIPEEAGNLLRADVRDLLAALAAAEQRCAALVGVLEAAGELADWLPGVWADYQGICHDDPCCLIPIDLEQMIHTIQAKGFALRDKVNAYYAARALLRDDAPGGKE